MAFHLKNSSIAEALLAVVLSAAIASCKPVENKPAPETQETSAGDADAAKTVKDFGPTLLKIAAQYSIEDHDTYSTLSASRYGFVDITGKIVIEPQWEEVSSFDLEELDKVSGFSEGIALVQRDGKWGWIDKTGRLFLPPFSSPASFHEGLSSLALVKESRTFGFIDRTGRIVIEPQWDVAKFYSEAQDDNKPFYWLIARAEKPESDQPRNKPKVRVLWLDSAGKQIWSSDNSAGRLNY